ncbi:MAG: hypothetical protein WCC35_26215, partial [Bradyrhizobium sp.]
MKLISVITRRQKARFAATNCGKRSANRHTDFRARAALNLSPEYLDSEDCRCGMRSWSGFH